MLGENTFRVCDANVQRRSRHGSGSGTSCCSRLPADGSDTRRALLRRTLCDGTIERVNDSWRRVWLRPWQAFELGILRLEFRDVMGADRQRLQLVGPRIIRNRNPDFSSNDGTYGDLNVSLRHILMDIV